MANLRFNLTVICIGLVLIALALGWFAPTLIEMLPEQVTPMHLLVAASVFVGLCGVAFYSLMERALNPVMRLIDTFTRMRAGDLNPRLPVEGPEEMRRMAHSFNDMVEDLESQIRDIEVDKQSAERDREEFEDRLSEVERFHWAIDAASVGVVIADANLNIVYQNPASESGFMQLDALEGVDPSLIGDPIVTLYPEELEAGSILSDPDRLPYEVDVRVGPHRLHYLTSAVYDEDEEFAGVIMIWEETERVDEESEEPEFSEEFVQSLEDEAIDFNEDLEPVDPEAGIDEEVLAEVDALEVDEAFEMIDEGELDLEEDVDEVVIEEDPVAEEAGQNGMHVVEETQEIDGDVQRSARLVQRSVKVLQERLDGVTTSIGALCDEGESLSRTIEEVRSQAERTDRLVDERSEPLADLVEDQESVGSRRAETLNLARNLKKGLNEAEDLDRSMDRLRGSIEHLVVSSRVELGRAESATGGLGVVVDAIGDLGDEASRLGESTHECIRRLGEQVEEVIRLVNQDADSVAHEARIGERAQRALTRIEDSRNESTQQNGLLSEMARGQAEIAQHIAKQVKELSELVTLTAKVAAEQVEVVEKQSTQTG